MVTSIVLIGGAAAALLYSLRQQPAPQARPVPIYAERRVK